MRALTKTGSLARLRRPRRRSGSTGGNSIRDERREGYVIDRIGKIRGEVKNYDPYSRFGEIMLYDIDEFGFVPGYISMKLHVMSEEDISVNKKLSKRLRQAKYQAWKRSNINRLLNEYSKYLNMEIFERFCVDMYRRTVGNKKG